MYRIPYASHLSNFDKSIKNRKTNLPTPNTPETRLHCPSSNRLEPRPLIGRSLTGLHNRTSRTSHNFQTSNLIPTTALRLPTQPHYGLQKKVAAYTSHHVQTLPAVSEIADPPTWTRKKHLFLSFACVREKSREREIIPKKGLCGLD